MNGNPGYRNATATMVDNYSQVLIDLARTQSGRIDLGIRFGCIDTYVMTMDTVPEIIW